MSIRKIVEVGLPLLGIVAVFAAILLVRGVQAQVGAALLGVLMIEAGVWRLTEPFLPSDRTYTELREEVDDFMGLVRELNSSAVRARASDRPEEWQRYRSVLDEMHRAVDRMARVAGKEAEAPPTSPPEGPEEAG